MIIVKVNNMASESNSNFDDIKISQEELYRLKNAFQDETFLKLFDDYVQDIRSEKSCKKYQQDIILLEKERGYDVQFLHPLPSYVLKFVTNSSKKFINICQDQNAGKPISTKRNRGTEWQIPVIVTKPRDDLDHKGKKCQVFDAAFHPDTLERASSSNAFKGIVEETATSMISQNFGLSLDLKSAKRPKLKYKGKPPHAVLRRKIGSKNSCEPAESLEEYVKKYVTPKLQKEKEATKPLRETTPKYTVKYRDVIDMQDFSLMGYTDKCAPKEIVVEIKLPLVRKTDEIVLDIFERKLKLESCENLEHCYRLDLDLSYAVKSEEGKAKFDRQSRMLTVQLPLKDRGIPVI